MVTDKRTHTRWHVPTLIPHTQTHIQCTMQRVKFMITLALIPLIFACKGAHIFLATMLSLNDRKEGFEIKIAYVLLWQICKDTTILFLLNFWVDNANENCEKKEWRFLLIFKLCPWKKIQKFIGKCFYALFYLHFPFGRPKSASTN